MAKNKLINDLNDIKMSKNKLMLNLINGGVEGVSTTDTLQVLVDKVPFIKDSTPIPSEKWTPDPLWKFDGKTIREIYDEDELASSYTKRAIYLISGDSDSTDLRSGFTSTMQVTFVLSDGTTYENTTGTTLIHNWDKSKDVIDSYGMPVRYISFYSNHTTTSVIPVNYGKSAIWIIYNFSETIGFSATQSNITGFNSDGILQCFELGDIVKATTSSNSQSGGTFLSCLKLKKVVLNKLKTLATYSFYDCQSLSDIDFGSDIQSIGAFSFYNCGIAEIVIPETVTSIGSSAFYGNIFAEITIPQTVTSFNLTGAFQDCQNLKKAFINASGTTKDLSRTFVNCPLLEEYNIPKDVTTANNAYLSPVSETSRVIIVPEGITAIGRTYWLTTLEYLQLPSSLITINAGSPNYLTGNNSSLRYLKLPIDFNISINISTCSLMGRTALIDVLENLKDLTGQTAKTITLGSINISKLTPEDILIATNKNWTVA